MVFTTRCASGSSQGRNGKRWLLPAARAGALVVGGVAGGAIISATAAPPRRPG